MLLFVQVRNPWGFNPDTETPLEWAPTSKLWSQRGADKMRQKLQYDPKHPGGAALVAVVVACGGVLLTLPRYCASPGDPGAFWMTFEDMLREFATVFVCGLLRFWQRVEVFGDWYGGRQIAAGGLVTGSSGANNPTFCMVVRRPVAMFITLTQT